MLKKIHSNRDPKDTLSSELQKEFGIYFDMAGGKLDKVLGRCPRVIFGIMVALLLASSILSFTVFRHPERKPGTIHTKATVDPVQEGFSQIMQATAKIRETLRLKKVVDSISAKKQMSATDSVALDSALTALQRIQSPLK